MTQIGRRAALKQLVAGSAGVCGLSALPGVAAEHPTRPGAPLIDSAKTLPDWDDLLALLQPAGTVNDITFDPADDQLRMELYRQLVMNLSLGYFVYFQTDPDFPDWIPFLNSAFLLQPNPDDVYHISRIADDGVYRITGYRGSVHLLLFSTGGDIMGSTDAIGGQNDVFDVDELTLGSDGSFEVILSREKPADHQGDWWPLKPGRGCVMCRQRSYDWAGEQSARFAIERVDRPAGTLKPRLSAPDTAARLQDVMRYAQRLSRMWIAYQNGIRKKLGDNVMDITGFNGAMSRQAYLQAVYAFEPDEAIILETEVPQPCGYWNFQINDALWNQVELVYRQSSLNGFQARLDSDGKFRGVIALNDLGVPNWLDSGGYREGMIIGRWLDADRQPLPVLKRVKLAELRDHLPKDTPVVSVQDRQAQLRLRTLGAQLRRRW